MNDKKKNIADIGGSIVRGDAQTANQGECAEAHTEECRNEGAKSSAYEHTVNVDDGDGKVKQGISARKLRDRILEIINRTL